MADFSMKRQRGRGRKPGGGGNFHGHSSGGGHSNQPNRSMESNGPEVKVRGPAALIHERYLQLARDAMASGDRVLSENYAQHADHYFRLLRQMQPATPPPQQTERFNGEPEFDRDEAASSEQDNSQARAPQDATAEQNEQEAGPQQQFDRDGRGRRNRRNRFRPGGESGEGPERQERPERPEPQRFDQQRDPSAERRDAAGPRDSGSRDSGPEGFSTGPRPAFLGNE